MKVLSLFNLTKDFTLHTHGKKTIRGFSGLSFEISQGHVLVLAGPSGAGKSSALKCIYRTYLPTSGRILYKTAAGPIVDLAALAEHRIIELRRREIGYVTQFLKVLPRVPAVDVVSEPLRQQGVSPREARREAARLLTRLNIAERLHDACPVTFSGGEQQRVNLARAVIARPRLLLLDEPTASLDADSVDLVLGLLNDLRRQGSTMVMICHDRSVAEKMADTILPMPRAGQPAVKLQNPVKPRGDRFVILNGDLVLRDRIAENTGLLIEAGNIARVGHLTPEDHQLPRVDAAGGLILPGFIDLHSDAIEKAISPRPRAQIPVEIALVELDKNLAASGITTMHHCISFTGKEENELRYYRRSAQLVCSLKRLSPDMLVRTCVHARYEILETRCVPLIKDLLNDRLIDLFSLMDHTPGQGQFRSKEDLVEYYTKAEHLSRQEVEQMVARRLQMQRRFDDRHIQDLVETCRQKGIPVASHDDDTTGKVAWMNGMGVNISEFPVTMAAAKKARALGMDVLMGAPNILFGRSLSNNLSGRDAVGAGCCNIIGSDYSPNTLLHAVFILARENFGTLPELIEMISFNPARAIGREKQIGSIAEGLAADLVIVDAAGEVPRVMRTFVDGKSVYACHHI